MRIIFPREWKSIHRMLTYSVDLTTCLKTGPATLSQGVICFAQNRRSATAGNINKVSTPTLVNLFIYHFKFRVCCFFKYIGNHRYFLVNTHKQILLFIINVSINKFYSQLYIVHIYLYMFFVNKYYL